ncbi:MAG: universal stress protein [Methanotrichaceae archaeon]|nr:universal stress protein [Methanotrichaceae archaeon]
MLEKVLVPTDFSEYSQKVLECIKEFPELKEVVLLHVIGPSGILSRVRDADPVARINEAETKLGQQKKFLENHGFNVKTIAESITEGDVSRGIQKVADEEKVSLIAMGARGKGVVEDIFLGNVAKNVLRYVNENLLLMRYNTLEGSWGLPLEKFCSKPFSKVLFPTDLSEPAAEAISFIKGIERVEEILLQHVVYSGETWKEIEAHVEEATKILNALGKEIEKAGPRVKVHVSAGSPAEEISNLAKEESVSLIAMGSWGKAYRKGSLNQLTVGSTAYDVAKKADRPVLIVRAGRNV